ncbi:kxDL motif-containing protein 1-like [Lineus longissimus]|uniref:kxDL motif-containing protein 1-like n=1 Tax=Lineus longissimus TaxID=88925 RepID=UPI00315DA2E9
MEEMPNGPGVLEKRELLSSEVFIKTLADFVDKNDVRTMVDDQRHMLSRFEKTNEMLLNFNVLSANRYAASVQEFKKHTQLLLDMKKDLDSIFRRIRNLKQTLSKQYPKAFNACGEVYDVMELAEDEEIIVSIPVPTSPALVKGESTQSMENEPGLGVEADSGLVQSKTSGREAKDSDSKEETLKTKS